MYARLIYLLAAIPFGIGTSLGANGNTSVAHFNKRYAVQNHYSGSDLIYIWNYDPGSDPTNGNVNYVDQSTALNSGLAYVDGNGNAVFAVDSWSSVPAGGNRNSVRVISPYSYNGGLFILDAVTIPAGCGVWPAFWTNGPNWPYSGEIDIVEGVNAQQYNQITLHSGSDTCSTNTNDPSAYTGSVLNPNCYSTPTADAGCSLYVNDPSSFAYGFNNAGGGVYAMEWNSNSISIWFFSRPNIPGDINAQAPNPGSWGTPAAYWDTSTCQISNDFYDHSMIFDTTICGGWAGSAYGNSGCPGQCSDIVADASNFADAFWTIKSVDVYQ